MKKCQFACLVLLTLMIPLRAQELRIQSFLPDSLSTWQLMGQMDGIMNFSNRDWDQDQTVSQVLESQSENLLKDRIFRTEPEINFHYRYIRPRRELFCDASAELYLYRHWLERETKDYGTEANPQSIQKKVAKSNTLSPEIETRVDYYEYLQNRMGLSLTGYLSQEWGRNRSRTDNKGWTDTQFQHSDDKQEENGRMKVSSATLEVGAFYGRIYDGSYAAKAMEIMEQLQQHSDLKRNLTEAEFKSLSEIIMRRMASYHYDSRIKKIEALTEIWDFLRAADVIEPGESLPLAMVQDLYLNSPFQVNRNFGFQCYLRLGYGRLRVHQESEIEAENRVYAFHFDGSHRPVRDSLLSSEEFETSNEQSVRGRVPSLVFGVTHANIINWHYWYESGLTLSYRAYPTKIKYEQEMQDGTETEIKSESDEQEFRAQLNGRLNYQFNNRSYLSLHLVANYWETESEEEMPDYDQYRRTMEQSQLILAPEFNYYLTPKISCRIALSTRWEKTSSTFQYTLSDDLIPHRKRSETRYIYGILSFGLQAYL